MISKYWKKVGSDMTWPAYSQGDIEWRLRYGNWDSLEKDRMRLASIVSAYQELIVKTQGERNFICKVLKEAEDGKG